MRKRLLAAVLSAGLLFATTGTSFAVTRQHYYHNYRYNSRARARYIRHRRHVNTARRVGIGAAGGAAIGALAGGGKGAAIGGIAGAGAGALYDNHQKHRGRN
jgi:outer membrane lipoprotein SlyB